MPHHHRTLIHVPQLLDSAPTAPGRTYSSPHRALITAVSATSNRSLHPGDGNHHDGLCVPYVRRWYGSVTALHRHIDHWLRRRHADRNRNNRSRAHHRDVSMLNRNGVIDRPRRRHINHRRSCVDNQCPGFSAGGNHEAQSGGGRCTDKTNIHVSSFRFDRQVSSSLEAVPPDHSHCWSALRIR